ncbi:hypothetical protein G6016_08850 [Dietzia aerolata]|uniref:Uncharacterized protein n=1 Tax=Dietzia aerolata TaxID=595984 RepID=A0ABV5JWB7_9ACTN|nr:hypothetical protein [Dietzia aerolata]MBB0969064.1 hypothetical protein [Dietzia aerolata]
MTHLINVVGAGGGAGVTTFTTLFGESARELSASALSSPPPPEASPWTVILATEGVEQASAAVALRETAIQHGWRVAALATRGTERKRPRPVTARFIPILDDDRDATLRRVPHWSAAARRPLAELPRWDFRGAAGKGGPALPKPFLSLFTAIVDDIVRDHDMEAAAAEEAETPPSEHFV